MNSSQLVVLALGLIAILLVYLYLMLMQSQRRARYIESAVEQIHDIDIPDQTPQEWTMGDPISFETPPESASLPDDITKQVAAMGNGNIAPTQLAVNDHAGNTFVNSSAVGDTSGLIQHTNPNAPEITQIRDSITKNTTVSGAIPSIAANHEIVNDSTRVTDDDILFGKKA